MITMYSTNSVSMRAIQPEHKQITQSSINKCELYNKKPEDNLKNQMLALAMFGAAMLGISSCTDDFSDYMKDPKPLVEASGGKPVDTEPYDSTKVDLVSKLEAMSSAEERYEWIVKDLKLDAPSATVANDVACNRIIYSDGHKAELYSQRVRTPNSDILEFKGMTIYRDFSDENANYNDILSKYTQTVTKANHGGLRITKTYLSDDPYNNVNVHDRVITEITPNYDRTYTYSQFTNNGNKVSCIISKGQDGRVYVGENVIQPYSDYTSRSFPPGMVLAGAGITEFNGEHTV